MTPAGGLSWVPKQVKLDAVFMHRTGRDVP
jgi:hypothetical protein